MKTLLAALRDGDELGKQLCELLQSPWCWPADPAIAAGLLGRGFAAPVPPVVGECALLSVSCEAPRFDALWRLTDGQPPEPETLPGLTLGQCRTPAAPAPRR